MSENVSGLLFVQLDEDNRPIGMEAMVSGDSLASDILPADVRGVVSGLEGVSSTVYDNSGTWEAGGDPQPDEWVRSASGDVESVSGSVASLVDGSSHWLSGYDYGLSAWDTVRDNSGTTWIAGGGGASADGFENWNNTFDNVNDSSSLRDRVSIVVKDTSGNWNNTSAVVDDASGNWNETDTWRSVSGTKCIGGATPTLANNLDAGNNDIENVVQVLRTGPIIVSGHDSYLLGRDTVRVGKTQAAASSLTDIIEDVGNTSGNWNTIYNDRTNIITTSARGDDVVATSGNWNTIYGDRTNIISVSGSVDASNTAWLNGDTPTLANDLNANSNNIRGVKELKGRDSGELLVSSAGRIDAHTYDGEIRLSSTGGTGAKIRLYSTGHNEFSSTLGIIFRQPGGVNNTKIIDHPADWVVSSLSSYDYSLSAWETVKDNSGTWEAGGGGSFEGSATASALYVGNETTGQEGSSIPISGTVAGDALPTRPRAGWYLSVDEAAGRGKWIQSPMVVEADGVTAGFGAGITKMNVEYATGSNVTNKGNQLAWNLSATVNLSGGEDLTTTFANSATISGMPIPAPYMWIRSESDGGAWIEQYWGSGTGALTINESGFPDASSSLFNDGYVVIPDDGVYLIYAKIGLNVTTSPTTISLIVITTTGFGGAETTLAMGTQVVRTNIDPHQGVVDYIGHFSSGTKVAVQLLANTPNTVKPERFASLRIQRIA